MSTTADAGPPVVPRRRGRGRAGGRLTASETFFLVIPALLPIVILSVLPLVRGIYLAFTDSRAGLDVPGDVALVGMDNSALCEVTWPTLTSVDLGSAERARVAAELLLERIENPDLEPRAVGVESELVVRASSVVPA